MAQVSTNWNLNERALRVADELARSASELGAVIHTIAGARVIDAGSKTLGSLEAGVLLARVCLSDLATVQIVPTDVAGLAVPGVAVNVRQPVAACMASQYAGWQISVGKFFAMGSGPMRAVAAKEPLFDKLWYREDAEQVVGVLETGKLPGADVFEYIAEETGVEPQDVVLCVAPTSSMAGNLQVVARSVETALHKLYELGFDVNRIRSAVGSAPLPPVAKNDMEGIGRTNDAILYGGRVTLWVKGDDESIADIITRVPSHSSTAYGRPFLEIFEAAGRDFYKIDPLLFSPAEIIIQNVDTGRVHVAGRVNVDVLKMSFGI